MAARLRQGDTTDAKVVRLPPRKAKGAKSSGGRKPPNRLKPKPGEAAPQAARAPKPAPAAPTPRPQPTDAEIRRNQQDRLIALHGKHRAIDNRIAVAQAAVDELRGEKKEVRASIQGAGFPLQVYDEAYRELKLKTKRRDLDEKERLRGLIREALGLPCGPQPELALEGVPDAARPALHWHGVGYQAALDGLFSDPARDGVPPEHLQDYQQGFSEVMARNAQGLKDLDAHPLIPPAPDPLFIGQTPKPPAPFYADWPLDLAEWSDEQRAEFKVWFDGLALDADVDIDHAAAEQLFDELAEPPLPAGAADAPGAASEFD